jgi:hypothetical protein
MKCALSLSVVRLTKRWYDDPYLKAVHVRFISGKNSAMSLIWNSPQNKEIFAKYVRAVSLFQNTVLIIGYIDSEYKEHRCPLCQL